MLVLTRSPGQSIKINDGIEITVQSVRGDKVSLGIIAPREVAVVRPDAVRNETARAMVYVVLLLRAWNKPVARAALEPALVLMLNDNARKQILGQAAQTVAKRAGAPSQGYVKGLDHLIGALESGGMVAIGERAGQQVLELGPRATEVPDPPQSDRQRVEETMRAFETLGEDRPRSSGS